MADALAQIRDPVKNTCSGRGEFRRKAPATMEDILRTWLREDMERHQGPVPITVTTNPALKAIWPPGGVFGANGNAFFFETDEALTADLWVFRPRCLHPGQV